MSDSNDKPEDKKPEAAPAAQQPDDSPGIHGIKGDSKDKLSLRLYAIPRGDNAKPDYVLAANLDEARRGAVIFFGKNVIVGKAAKAPAIGHRVLVQVQARESQPDHVGFVMEEWSKEHIEAAIV